MMTHFMFNFVVKFSSLDQCQLTSAGLRKRVKVVGGRWLVGSDTWSVLPLFNREDGNEKNTKWKQSHRGWSDHSNWADGVQINMVIDNKSSNLTHPEWRHALSMQVWMCMSVCAFGHLCARKLIPSWGGKMGAVGHENSDWQKEVHSLVPS